LPLLSEYQVDQQKLPTLLGGFGGEVVCFIEALLWICGVGVDRFCGLTGSLEERKFRMADKPGVGGTIEGGDLGLMRRIALSLSAFVTGVLSLGIAYYDVRRFTEVLSGWYAGGLAGACVLLIGTSVWSCSEDHRGDPQRIRAASCRGLTA
jgi:hypothetical protein